MMFDPATATEDEILDLGRSLVGKRLGQLGSILPALPAGRSRGQAGLAVEAFFGIPPNSDARADFTGAGIELKVVPMKRSGRGLTPKERTVISMIDFEDLVLQTWQTAKVRGKLKILFVFFEHLPGRPKSDFPILKILLWEPDATTERFLHADWERAKRKVRLGKAHELSESDGRLMGPCTKGMDGSRRRSQPFSDIPAKPRAFALKPSFTGEIYRSTNGRPEESLVENLSLSRLDRFEAELLARFTQFAGKRVGDAAVELNMPISESKGFAANVVRRAFGAHDPRGRLKEFAEMGLTLRISRVSPDLTPYESLSFPAFAYRELLEETWEDSDLLSRVEYMLLVPIHGPRKGTPQPDCVLGTPVFWRPTSDDLELIRREWEIYRVEIEKGKANELTPASETIAVHVRPHGRDKQDTDDAPVIGPVVKKSFWLNRPFVRSILRGER
jgi:DNA mismatch repair endonuclease MutH